jgi:gluconate 2-dehydrogenase gamma chain
VTLDSEQAADIEAMCAVIIPSDATPGASEAGVVHFVDHAIATWAAFQREAILHGLADLNAQARARWPGSGRFATLSPEQQIAMVRHAEPTPFFWAIRFLTIVGMFALPEYGGNSEKAGWRLIGFDDRYRWQPPFGAYDGERVTSSR